MTKNQKLGISVSASMMLALIIFSIFEGILHLDLFLQTVGMILIVGLMITTTWKDPDKSAKKEEG